MDPTPDEATAPSPPAPSRWNAYGRPALARAIASGLALGLATVPLVVFLFFAADRDVERCALMVAFMAAVGAVAGAPGAALEDWAERRAGPRRSVVAPLLCGLLVPLVALLLGVQMDYVRAVSVGGVEQGMDRLAVMLESVHGDPARAIGVGGGGLVGLASPMAALVWLRLRRAAPSRQALFGFLLVLAGGAANALTGGFVLWRMIGAGAFADLLQTSPILTGVVSASVLAGLLLLLVGLASTLLLPPALAVADRCRLDRG